MSFFFGRRENIRLIARRQKERQIEEDNQKAKECKEED